MIRGSSDIANEVDFILGTGLKGKQLILDRLKQRNAQELPPIGINKEVQEGKLIRFEADEVMGMQ